MRPTQQVVVVGQESPDVGVNISAIETNMGLSLNAAGQVAFGATLSGTGVATSGEFPDHQGIYLFTPGTGLTKVMRRSDLAVDVPPAFPIPTLYGAGSSSFSTFVGSSSMVLDQTGALSFRPGLIYGDVSGTSNDQAYYAGDPDSPTLIVRKGSFLPTSAATGGLTTGHQITALDANANLNAGQLVFVGSVGTGAGIFIGSSSNFATIAYANTTSGTLIGADRITGMLTSARRGVNAAGVVLFGASLNATNTTNNTSLIAGSSASSLTIIARSGGVSPIAADVNYGSVDTSDRSIAGDYIGFLSTLTGAGVTTSTASLLKNSSALFLTDSAGTVKPLVREGDLVPGGMYIADRPNTNTVAFRLNALDNVKLSSSGWLQFSANLRTGTNATGNTAYEGIFTGRIDPDSGTPDVRKIAVEGDRKGFSQAAIHAERGDFAWTLDRWAGLNAAASSVNANGQVVFFAGASGEGVLTEVDGYYFYDPALGRAFRLITAGDQILADADGPGPGAAAPRTISSITAITNAEGGGDDGDRSIFNASKTLAFRASFEGGGSGVFTLDADDYLPSSFHVWNQAAGGEWSTAGNWTGGAADGAKTYAEFSSAITAPAPITVTGAKTVGELYFNSSNRVTLSGDALTMNGVAGAAYVGVARGDHEVATGVVLANTTSFILDNTVLPDDPAGTTVSIVPTSLKLSGVVSGTGDLRKGGPGVLTLANANTYTGNTILRAGYLEVASSASLGSASNSISLDGGVLRFLDGWSEARPINITAASRETSDIRGGFDTGTNTVTLTGLVTFETNSSDSDGYVVKSGAGKLVMANTGGIGGIEITGGSVDVTTPQIWGEATSRARNGATLTVTPTGSITSTRGAAFTASGGGTMVFDGPVDTSGVILADFSATDGPSTVTINVPVTVGGLTVNDRSGTNVAPALLSTMNVNADPVVNGAVIVDAQGTNLSRLNIAPGVTVTARSFAMDGIVVSGTSNAFIQTGTSSSTSAFGIISSGTGFNPSGTVTAAADVGMGGAGASTYSGPVTVGRDVRITGSNDTLTFAGPFLTVGRDVEMSGGAGSTNGNTINFNSPVTAINGIVTLDSDVHLDNNTVNFTGNGTSGGMLIQLRSVTVQVSGTSRVNIAAGATHTTGDITINTSRASASSTGTNRLDGIAKLNVAGTLDGGGLLIRTDEYLAGRNNAVASVEVTGNATLSNIVHISRRGTNAAALAPLPEPIVGTADVRISGSVKIRPNGGTVGTSLLGKLPNFEGTGRLDLTDNALIVNYTLDAVNTTSPLPSVRAHIISGFAGGAWTGTGVTSSTAAADSTRGIGYAEASQILGIGGTSTATFRGRPVDATSVLVRSTFLGDTDLNGTVDFNDLVRLAQNYNDMTGTALWYQADFTYDGNVNFDDLVKLAQNYNQTLPAGPIAGAPVGFDQDLAAAFASVPEPGSVAFAALAAGTALARRRRR